MRWERRRCVGQVAGLPGQTGAPAEAHHVGQEHHLDEDPDSDTRGRR